MRHKYREMIISASYGGVRPAIVCLQPDSTSNLRLSALTLAFFVKFPDVTVSLIKFAHAVKNSHRLLFPVKNGLENFKNSK